MGSRRSRPQHKRDLGLDDLLVDAEPTPGGRLAVRGVAKATQLRYHLRFHEIGRAPEGRSKILALVKS